METPVQDCDVDSNVVRIGVVGHRANIITSADAEALRDPIDRVLDDLCSVQEAGCSLRIITSLAEGADRLVAREALRRGVLETVVLPFHRDRFERDFATAESRREFRELLDAGARVIEPDEAVVLPATEGYRQASDTVIGCSDALIAIWDGEPGRGPGGTAHSIGHALGRDIPVIWISSHPPYDVEVMVTNLAERHAPLFLALDRIIAWRSRAARANGPPAGSAPDARS
jgi:hypothetical protein